MAAKAAAGHRALLVLAGDRMAGLDVATALVDRIDPGRRVSLSGHEAAPSPRLEAPKPAQLVGRELDAAVLDAYDGFDADTFGAIAGTVRGGGLLVLCCPPLDDWPGFDDPLRERLAVFGVDAAAIGRRYLQRFSRRLRASDAARVIDPITMDRPRPIDPPVVAPVIWSAAQRDAVDAVSHVVTGQRRRPAVLIADRGRGKSAALGHAAARLLHDGARRIVVSAASRAGAAIVFRHAGEALNDVGDVRRAIRRGHGLIEFVEPGQLLEIEPTDVDLVLIDEAAAMPLHWLERVLERFPRAAFATTVHGYEGSGRGFATRFDRLLARHTRGWRRVELTEPVRYAPGDPVERLLFDLLVLDAELPAFDETQTPPGALRVETLDRDRLVDDEAQLREFFALLVAAHYRTHPNDLRDLLDGPNVELVAAIEDGCVVGAAVVAHEGGFDPATAARVAAGQARPRGHMLAETVCAQLGESEWPRAWGLRVVRLAVHPARRRRGVGRRILAHVERMARAAGRGYIGSSFAIGADVGAFWRSAGYDPLWLGARRNATSGARSLLVVRPLDPDAADMARRARQRFLFGFRVRLAGLYADEDPAHVALLFENAPAIGQPGSADLADVAAFVAGERNFESCFTGLWQCAPIVLGEPSLASRLDSGERDLLIRLVLQQRDPARAGRDASLSGRRAALETLAAVFGRMMAGLRLEMDGERSEP